MTISSATARTGSSTAATWPAGRLAMRHTESDTKAILSCQRAAVCARDGGLEAAGQLVAVDPLGREDAADGAVLGAQEPQEDVLAADLAVAAAPGLDQRALEPVLRGGAPARLGAAAVGGQVEAAGVDADADEDALEVAVDGLAQLGRVEPHVAQRVARAVLPGGQRDQQVLGLDGGGAEPGGDRARLD